MPHQKNKKILIYFFLFIILGTINNKNLNKIVIPKINKITVEGLDENNNLKIKKNLNFLASKNLFFLDDLQIKEIIRSNHLVDKYYVFKKYPSSLNIKVKKTNFLAKVKKKNSIYLLGSNGKLMISKNTKENIPFIFGNFDNKNFFHLKKIIDEVGFDYSKIKNLYFFKSGRWDIELNTGLLIKLPNKQIKKSLKLANEILSKDDENEINKIDLRQQNQIIINE